MDKSYQVYLIEDINDLRYYGMTSTKLSIRLTGHRCKYRYNYGVCSSCRLNLYNSVIICLEDNLTEKEAIEREKYYIRNNECVNERTYIFDKKKFQREYRDKNREKLRISLKQYREKNKDKIREKKKEYREKNKEIIREKKTEYYEKNKDKISERGKIKWHCDICNSNIRFRDKSRHLKSPKHINNSLK